MFSGGDEVQVIAEIGVNHNGDLDLAKELIKQAKSAGAQWVKLQSYITQNIVTAKFGSAPYQKSSSDLASQFEMLKRYELSFDAQAMLCEYAKHLGIGFLSTPFDIESLHFIVSLGVPVLKIASGEITNIPLLREVALSGLPVILSTGMSTIEEIDEAVRILAVRGEHLCILHCVSQYPTYDSAVNLSVMDSLRERYKTNVGFSDHTVGSLAAICAVARGARIVEKHITLNSAMKGPDHKASMQVEELAKFVEDLKRAQTLVGSGSKTLTQGELINQHFARKKIVAKSEILAGELFTHENITTKRSESGVGAEHWDSVVGSVATKSYFPDDPLLS